MTVKALVVGAGAAGLRTALELLRRNVKVVLRAPYHPLDPRTCSMGAGGLWMPFHADDPRVTRWSMETLDELMPIAMDETNDLVELVDAIYLMKEHGGPVVEDFTKNKYELKRGLVTEHAKLPEWSRDERLQFQHLTVEMLSWQNLVLKLKIPPENEIKDAGYLYSWFFKTPVVNSPKMLEHYLQLVQEQADDVDVETGVMYESIDHIYDSAKDLGCNAVINCTGLGARELLGDKELVGARGILHLYDRNTCERRSEVSEGLYGKNTKDAIIMAEESPWGSDELPCYMIPRGEDLVVGGSYQEGNATATISEDEKMRLLGNAALLGVDVEKSLPKATWTGFRPYRAITRCELGESSPDGITLVHNYGFGGSGWTINAGAAKECTKILLDAVSKS